MALERYSASRWPLVALYVLLLIYGTLFPLQPLPWDAPVAFDRLLDWERAWRFLSKADGATNWLVYIPLGWLSFRQWLVQFPRGWAFLGALLLGAGLSLMLEFLQLYLPARVPSPVDIFFNVLGTASGALLAWILPASPVGPWLKGKRETILQRGPLADLGLMVVGFWLLSEWMPLVPVFDMAELKHGVEPIREVIEGARQPHFGKIAVYAMNLLALGFLLSRLLKPERNTILVFLLFFLSGLTAKVLIVWRQLSLESLMGLGVAACLLWLLDSRLQSWMRGGVAIGLLVAAELTGGLYARGSHAREALRAFNWVPLAGQQNSISGMIDLLSSAWPALAMAFFTVAAVRKIRAGRWIMLLGAFVVFSLEFYIEWRQRFLPGRYADVTDVLVAVAAWFFVWYWAERWRLMAAGAVTASRFRFFHFLFLRGLVLAVGGLLAVGWFFPQLGASFTGGTHTATELHRLPPMPRFHDDHPRLPAPSAAEIKILQARYSGTVQQWQRAANHGRGNLEAMLLTAMLDPSQVDLEQLTARLLALQYSGRGHRQAMPMAQAYDWLYPRLSPLQRRKLQQKLAEGCQYLSGFIRKHALSPYNVYLYNSPLQALMAVSLALYRDHPQGERCLAFTYDLWKHRVLPVWRQVMGRAGGWHEGGEYVGIGIGKAIYSVPAMWRSATGEDMFRGSQGIRGFLDFLIYRHRPDHTHMRWGDSGYFDKTSPDRYALALEYRHRAAYTFFGCRPQLPTAWPWGPLPDDSLCVKDSIAKLPLQRYFNGIGTVIARSDWGDDATYVTFKAGDNFWSHSHLDQGAFTLYKGGPLAIDSGLYGPRYGSDHHLNYAYQTIAHNAMTVTDPDDNAPLPERGENKPLRPIANDGGQRRAGSGWGKGAPRDVRDWQRQRETYHTGRIARYYAGDGLVIAVADLTPAYTNQRCGKGNFHDRTCRVSRYWRTFIYDRQEDVVLIYDDVTAVRPEFVKRSLLHFLGRPRIGQGRLTVETGPDPAMSRQGGKLEVAVLFPENATIRPVGGPGAEFLVDGKNYDEQGAVWRRVAHHRPPKPEPGRWRVEIMPPPGHLRDRFLMVLKPSLAGKIHPVTVSALREKNILGCRLQGSARNLRFKFPANRMGVVVEFDNGRRVALTLVPS